MRRQASCAITASLGICLLWAAAAAADKDTYQSPKDSAKKKESGWSWWPFGTKQKDEPAKPDKGKASTAAKAKSSAARPSNLSTVAEQSSLAAKERQKVLRRQEVCDKLRAIAQETNDASLDAQAQLLEQRAWFIYDQRTASARLPGLLPRDDTVAARKLVQETPPATRADAERPFRSVLARNANSETRKED